MAKPTADPPPSASPFPFTAQEAMEFMQRIWNPFGVPMPAFGPATPPPAAGADAPAGGAPAAPGLYYPNPASMFMTLDPEEVERKIGELRVIEGWLAMSLNFMQMSIRTLELQKASLEALRGSGQPNPRQDAGRDRG